MKQRSRACSGFSLAEVVLALGVAALAFIAVLGMMPVGLKIQQSSVQQTTANEIISEIADELRAAIRLPPGLAAQLNDLDPQDKKTKTLNSHWQLVATPDTLYYTNEGEWTGGVSPASAPVNTTFKATITYLAPPTATTSIAKITVSWPAAQSDLTKVAGSVEMFVAVNR